MKNGLVSFAPFTLNGTNISECSSYVYLGREINMMNDLAPELSRRKRAAWGAFKSIEDVVKRTKNTRLRAHLFDSTVLPALTYASETWSLRKQDERSLSVIERSVERTMLGVSRFAQVRDGIRSSDLRQRSKIKDAVLYAKQSKIRIKHEEYEEAAKIPGQMEAAWIKKNYDDDLCLQCMYTCIRVLDRRLDHANKHDKKYHREGLTFFEVIIGDFNAKTGPRRTTEKRYIETHGLEQSEQERNLTFTITNFTLPVQMAFSDSSSVLAQVPYLSSSEKNTKTFTENLVSNAVRDVLEEHGCYEAVSDAVRMATTHEITAEVNYLPLRCATVLVNPMPSEQLKREFDRFCSTFFLCAVFFVLIDFGKISSNASATTSYSKLPPPMNLIQFNSPPTC
uniref:C2H2-type domain-containing protein n=1 Tax=Angiostrongylus cantonensis TaxID=6313 RepID=A0A0K0DQW0_ANGCA